jgi:MFS family permease
MLAVPGANWSGWFMAVIYLGIPVFGSAAMVAGHRSALNYVQEESRFGYTNLWILVQAFTLGLPPVIGGYLIEAFGLTGFRICFAISGIGGIVVAMAAPHLVRDGEPVAASWRAMLNPTIPLRTMARVTWITLGLHESNRKTAEAAEE